jgi:hypothetical protein
MAQGAANMTDPNIDEITVFRCPLQNGQTLDPGI